LLPSPSTQSRFRPDVPGQDSLDWQTARGQRLVARGQVTPGQPVKVAGPTIQTSSRQAMQSSFITPEERSGQALRTCSTQAPPAQQPRIARATSAGTTVSHVTRRLARLTRDLRGRDGLRGADNAGSGGPLLQERHTQGGVTVLPPGKRSPQRLAAYDAVPLEQYDRTVGGHGAAVYTTMTPCDGPLRVRRKKRRHGTYGALMTPAGALTAATAMPTDTTRWRIENCCAENAFLGVDHLPALHLKALQTGLSLRRLAFHVVDNFRHDWGPAYQKKTPELLQRAFVDGVQGRVQLRRDIIEVRVYGFEHAAAAAAILPNRDAKLASAGVDPCIPWLGNRR